MIVWQPGRSLEEVEKDVILAALRFYHNNKTHTARSLGIAARTLDNKLEKYNGSLAKSDPPSSNDKNGADVASPPEKPPVSVRSGNKTKIP